MPFALRFRKDENAAVNMPRFPKWDRAPPKLAHLPRVPLGACVVGPSGSRKSVWLQQACRDWYRGSVPKDLRFCSLDSRGQRLNTSKRMLFENTPSEHPKEQCFFDTFDVPKLEEIIEALESWQPKRPRATRGYGAF